MNFSQYITCIPNSGHRIGHKLNDLITGFILAEWYGLEYIHSALPDKWESFFGFGEGEKLFTEVVKNNDISIISWSPLLGVQRFHSKQYFLLDYLETLETKGRRFLKKIPVSKIRQWRKPYWDGVPFEVIEHFFLNNQYQQNDMIYCFHKAVRVMLYQVHTWGKEGKIDSNIYHNVIQNLRNKYHTKPHYAKKSYFEPEVYNIAIHIRRDDATINNNRFLSLDFYQNIFRQIQEVFKYENYEFHIYSSGKTKEMNQIRETFSQLTKQVKFHLNESAMEAIHHMAIADILVTGHSSFSDWAGFLSHNVKLYHPHFHMFNLDETEWIKVDDQGNFNQDCFQDRLENLINSKLLN